MDYPILTATEFQTLVLIYAAHADYKYSSIEERIIKLHSYGNDYEKMLSLFNEHSDYNILRIVLENKKRFCDSEESKKKLYDLIECIFLADGDYSRPEKVFLNFLNRMINT